jgi:hypothetical protein
METRSKKANAAAAATPDQDRRSVKSSRAPSPNSSGRSSVRTSSSIKKQRLLQLELEVAEERAAIKEQLLREKTAIKARILEDQDDAASSQMSSPSSHHRSSGKPSKNNNPCNHQPMLQHPSHSSFNIAQEMSKLMARQTCAKELPQFSGEPEEWSLFYSHYRTSTLLCAYSDDENIARLSRCLRGRARDSASALLLSATNLEKIISTLKLRFGRPEFIIDIMLSKLRQTKFIRHDDINAFIEFATKIQNMVATMHVTEVTGHLTNPSLIKEIINKLPSNMKFQWAMYVTNKIDNPMTVTLDNLCEWLMEMANAATVIAPSPVHETNQQTHFKKQTCLATTSNTPKQTCVRCRGVHSLEDCASFKQLSTNDRWSLVTKKKLCFSCLSSEHQLKSCRLRRRCTIDGCERVHHTLLHADQLRQTKYEDEPVTQTITAPVNTCMNRVECC